MNIVNPFFGFVGVLIGLAAIALLAVVFNQSLKALGSILEPKAKN